MIHTALPFWPRLLGAELAAAYLGISRTAFLDGVDGFTYPGPIRQGRRVLWDRVRLDRYVDALSVLPPQQASEESGTWDDL
jgi:predicted DNA-binding transcriptional regulator AlpA